MQLTEEQISKWMDLAYPGHTRRDFEVAKAAIGFAAHNAGAQDSADDAFEVWKDDPRFYQWNTTDEHAALNFSAGWNAHAVAHPQPQTDAARDTARLNALEADVEVCRHVNPDYWTSRRVGHPWGKTKHADLRSAIDAEIERLDRAKGESDK